ncbi:MAG: DUF6291 domain-containing protein [Treponema sp.]|jgi:hypothetical protein|nr:DUF6291 domain-containing protein [Treponema sp.]
MTSNFRTFVMSETLLKQINALSDELQLKFYRAVANYGIHGIEPEFTGLELVLWILMKDSIGRKKKRTSEA